MHSTYRTLFHRAGFVLGVALTPLLLLAAVLIAYQDNTQASSHREAPLISKDPSADNTDTYVFISPENLNNIVFVGSWIPLEGPEGGPNYFEWDPSALYDIYVDNDGDAKPDITFTLSSRVNTAIPTTFLYNVNSITSLDDADWNRRQYITIKEQLEDGAVNTLVNDKLTTPVNIGSKSTPDFETLMKQASYAINTAQGAGKAFGGQTDDPFWVDLQVFDLLTLRGQQVTPLKPGGPPPGYPSGNNVPVDSVSAHNVHSLVIEVPIAHVTKDNKPSDQTTEPVIGMWAGTRRPTTTVIQALNTISYTGPYVQVSRLGMPLVNEVVIPLALKDAFNSLKPSQDLVLYTYSGSDPFLQTVQQLLQRSVEDPEIGRLLCGLYGAPLPEDADDNCSTEYTTPGSGRGDIFGIFLTGMKLAKPFTIQTKNGPVELAAGANVNQPANVVPAEMIRINTTLKGDLCSPTPSRLGVLGGDACGFPNGRRLTDDIVEIELLAVAGAAYQVLDGADASFSFNPALLGILTDGVDYNDIPFYGAANNKGAPPTKFPYLGLAQSGQAHWHTNPYFLVLAPWVNK
jgi:hypothetical protein